MRVKRKRYIVDWKFQLRFSLMLVLPVLILGGVVIISIFNISKSVLIAQRQQLMTQIASLERVFSRINEISMEKKTNFELKNNIGNLKSFSHDLINANILTLDQLNTLLIKGIFIFVVGLLIFGIFYSHRIVGPIYRIKHLLKNIGEDLRIPFNVRLTDEFYDFFLALENIRKHFLDSRTKAREAIEHISQGLQDIQTGLPPEMSAKIEKLKQEVEGLKGKL
ncbi:MAG: hypothetical protein NC928_06010 [Candidatus Omnitrophica bacterium]|nr:hypothetical protein [Candidatus Omnitrophota bacterium]